MIVIPAIDLKDGKCVRLKEGKMNEVTIFSDDPLHTSSTWFSQGAELLHIVDLDGAVVGKPINDEIISINNNTRLPKSYHRFQGLMEKLFLTKKIESETEILMHM